MKNVLQIIPDFGLAGAEIMCETLCYMLDKSQRFHVFAVSLYDRHTPITDRLERNNVPLLYLNKKKGVDLSLIWKLSRIMKRYKIDIVHTHLYVMPYAIPAAIIAGVSNRVHTIHNVAEKEVSASRRKLACFFYKYFHVIPVSISPQIWQSVVKEYGAQFQDSPIVFNGTNLNSCLIKNTYVSNVTFRFIHIGRFSPQKNHRLILNAIYELKNAHIDVHINLIGDGEEVSNCKQYVKDLGIEKEVSFCGLTDNVFPYLSESDCFILPSIYEGMPVSLVEAMGCGLPIIATRVGGIPDMVEDGVSGILIESNLSSLVQAMTTIIRDYDLRVQLGINALRRSKLFSAEKMLNGYAEIYDRNDY